MLLTDCNSKQNTTVGPTPDEPELRPSEKRNKHHHFLQTRYERQVSLVSYRISNAGLSLRNAAFPASSEVRFRAVGFHGAASQKAAFFTLNVIYLSFKRSQLPVLLFFLPH